MKAKKHRTLIIVLGIALAAGLSLMSYGNVHQSTDNSKIDVLSKYKSSVPLITAPLQILAKGLNIVNK